MISDVAKVKDAVDIVALIGERITLKRSGNSYKGLCPFHGEKSPSFFVNPVMGRYMCFGCHETGDCFTFLQKYDQMTFGEALRFLAQKTGIELTSYTPTHEDQQRERLTQALSLAREFYHYMLTTHQQGEAVRAYVGERGLKHETIELFGIGASIDQWDALFKYLTQKKGFTPEELVDAGLVIRSAKGSYYDRFRNRLMFPLTNPRGLVVGFSGRLLDKYAKEAKYINSPETVLYHKSELLFGYSQLHRFIAEKEEVYVMEGEFDVLSSYQAHVGNVVAIKGSAISEYQMKLLARSCKRIIFSLDSDSAGKEATKRAIEVAKNIDVSLRVLTVAGGKDPDEVAREHPAVWRETVKKTITVYDYLIDLAFQQHDNASGDGKREITNELIPLLVGMTNAVEQSHYVQKVAKRLGVREDVLLTQMRRAHLPTISIEKPTVEVETPPDRQTVLTKYLLALLFHMEGQAFATHLNEVEAFVQDPVHVRLAEIAQKNAGHFVLSAFVAELPEELKQPFATLYMEQDEAIQTVDVETEFSSALHELQELERKQRRVSAAARISELENKETLSPEEEREYSLLLSQLAV
ncbi:DNA primase [Candidatus Cerribacteria bacterium 'Amazon FNV 2010 28 9']|uniref:DNA primase n=1 Tax=Candidatus Cerribacteria bacterium 'Amazon FNV 2010 28 9' TaxID=2081795 RepID=A0A317JRM0_9BACT|nr:MAG: DNA primase [Candidatus Cerribacteria bacterium 'Amazon FNV 2010 28 9']